MMRNKITGFVMIVAATTSLLSCSETMDQPNGPTALRVEVEDGIDKATTRVAYNGYHTDFSQGDAIGVYAFDGTKYVYSNVKFTRSESGEWTSDTKVINSPAYTYYAYFPYVDSPYSPSTAAGDADTKFAAFINDADDKFWKADQSTKANYDASNLMISTGVMQSDNKTVKFTMNHKRGLAVISNVDNVWYYSSDASTTYPCTPVFSTNIPYTINNNNYYLVKPNIATSFAGLSLNISAGKYQISDAIRLTGTPTYTYSTSYDDGTTWSDYSTSKPSWLTISTTVGGGATTNFSNTVPILPTPTADERNKVLKNQTAVSDYDLSMHNNDGTARSSRTTANCYLVHAPGTYKLPLVYGNAIKNGTENESAYHTTQTSNTLQNLVNHNDAAIYTGNATNDPWIKNHSISVDGASLIWQDVKGLISNVGINGDYLTFTVSADNIDEGNAVIAATARGTVVWSWHIWVTQETLAKSELTTINTGSHTYQVSPVNVGQHVKYKNAMCRVRATSNNVTIQYQITSLYNYEYGTEPYYQWGRKDAELPSNGGYDINGNAVTIGITQSAVSIGTTIQNPNTHYSDDLGYGPYNQNRYNYWDMNQTGTKNITTATVKTVYDPCPPDFCIPTGNLYYYMGENSSYTIWEDYGSHVGRLWTHDTPNIFFPASGERTPKNGSLADIRSFGEYCSASVYIVNYYHHLIFGSSAWSNSYSRNAKGIPVRPVSE